MTVHGFLLGKFMPPHAGHLLCAQVGRARVDVMTVLVCSHDAEAIDGYLRADLMRSCLPERGFRVIHMHRDIPQAPEDHPDFWPIWRAAIAEHHPEPIDWVFGSDTYIHRLAQEVGARAFPVDPDRRVVPVSGTAIRSDPAAHWSYVPGPVRPLYQKRLTMLGAESTGKTTLSEDLAARTGTVPIPEYGRDYDALYRHGQAWIASDFEAIMAGHNALASCMAERSGPLIVEDTDEVQTLVWAEALTGEAPDQLVACARAASCGKRYVLLGHDLPWIDDGTRHFPDPERRAWFTQKLAHWLDAFDADWVAVEGPDRAAAVHAEFDALSARSAPNIPRHGRPSD
ncbi:AAA family ATPase [Gymnodinialimonas hymeniacidonis]|uniref:AAA family ATPase n=1 Tax=Gymnodinialimonas hymeniacidonis TaxID=3126508 RepID=UPI0034C5D692